MGTLQSTGSISLKQIATHFSDTAPHSIKEFYRDATTTTSNITVSPPSSDGTYNDFGGVTGLTLVKTSTTVNTGFVVFRNFNANSAGGPVTFYPTNNNGFFPNNGNPFTRIDVRLRRSSGNSVNAVISRNQQVSSGGLTNVDTTGNSHLLAQVTQQGSYRYNVGDDSQMKEEQDRYSINTVYTFTNNTNHNVIIEGITIASTASATITLSGDFNITFTQSANVLVPSVLSGSGSMSVPSTDGTHNNNIISGLTVKRTPRVTASTTTVSDSNSGVATITLVSGEYYNFRVRLNMTNSAGNGGTRGAIAINSTSNDPGLAVTTNSTGSFGSTNVNNFRETATILDYTDGVIPSNYAKSSTAIQVFRENATTHSSGVAEVRTADNQTLHRTIMQFRGVDGLHNGTITQDIFISGFATTNNTLTVFTPGDTVIQNIANVSNQNSGHNRRGTITSTFPTMTQEGNNPSYFWTNGTGGTVTVEGTSLSSTDQLIMPDNTGNFAVAFANAQVNSNVPESGQITIKGFYGATVA